MYSQGKGVRRQIEEVMRLHRYFIPVVLSVAFIFISEAYAASDASFKSSKLSDNTLRVDYTFSGNAGRCAIYLDELVTFPGWAGRRTNMNRLHLLGNGQIWMRDAETGDTLYCNSFSTLFQEWQSTEEATKVQKSFENVFLMPMPTVPVDITVELSDVYNKVVSSMTHRVDPSDILIHPAGQKPAEFRYLHKGGSVEDAIDVVILPEGYTAEEMEQFYSDAGKAVESILSHEPFRTLQGRFNFLAVNLASQESGVSIPARNVWKKTALGSHFDTFYTERYLTTLRLRNMHDMLSGIPYEHIIILANTDNYGGGGIYNSYTLTAAHHSTEPKVVVHEFGHSFGGLADEYYYDDQFENYYNSETEPWEQNITTQVDFESKWQDMIEPGTPVPTPAPASNPRAVKTVKERKAVDTLPEVGLFEGGGYMSKGVWRGSFDCRMHTNEYSDFCPVCRRALERIIRYYTEETEK